MYKVKYWESNFKVEVWLVEEERFHGFVEEVYFSLYHLSALSFQYLILCSFLFCVIYLSDNLKSIKVINDLIKNQFSINCDFRHNYIPAFFDFS